MSPFMFLFIALTLIILWGTAFTMISVGVAYISPMWLVVLRCLIAAGLVIAYVYMSGEKLPGLSDRGWLWYGALGFTGIVFPFFLTATGQLKVDSGISAILVGAMPIMTIILAHFFANEPLNWRKTLGFLIGFFGIVLLFLPDDLNFGLVKHWPYQLLLIAAAFCYAGTTVAVKRAPQTSSKVSAAMMLIAAALFALIGGLIEGIPAWPIATQAWAMAAGLGIGSTAIGTILYLYFIERCGPSAVAKVNYFPPVAAVITGVWILKEPFTLRIAAAFIIILAGVIIAGKERPVQEKI
jgi:drug/metabolite transporter (DMT)-like permease